MPRPVRIKLSRKKGWRLQEHSRKINGLPARAVTRPGPFGNPYKVGKDGTRRECVDRFRRDMEGALKGSIILHRLVAQAMMRELRGQNLACHCSLNEPCHADVLLELANAEEPDA